MTSPTVTTTTSLLKTVTAIAGPVITAFIIGASTLVYKMDKLTERLTYSFETVAAQVKTHDSKLEEIDRRIRLLELEVALTKRGIDAPR